MNVSFSGPGAGAPGVPTNTIPPGRLTDALSTLELAMEQDGGWPDDQLYSSLRGSDSLRHELRCLPRAARWQSQVKWCGIRCGIW